MDVSVVELLWVVGNALGLGVSFFGIYDAQYDFRNTSRPLTRLASRIHLRNESFKVVLYILFLAVGVRASFQPGDPEPMTVAELVTVIILLLPVYYGVYGSFRNRSDRRTMNQLDDGTNGENDDDRTVNQNRREGGQNLREGEQNVREEHQNVRDRKSTVAEGHQDVRGEAQDVREREQDIRDERSP